MFVQAHTRDNTSLETRHENVHRHHHKQSNKLPFTHARGVQDRKGEGKQMDEQTQIKTKET